MTRMPMIAVISLLLLLLLQVPTSTLGKPTNTPTAEEQTTSFGDTDVNTVTIEVDSDLILTTEDTMHSFTQLPESEFASTEEPLPKSVLLQLERERAEAKNASRNANLIESTTITTPLPMAPEAATTIAIEAARNEMHSSYSQQDLDMKENKVEAAVETTTFLPQFEATVTPEDILAFYAKTSSYETNSEDTTTFIPSDDYKYTSGPLPADAEKFGSEVTTAEENTWVPSFEGIFESTETGDVMAESTPTPENQNKPTESSISSNESPITTVADNQHVDLVDLLRMMSSDVITDKIMQESAVDAQLTTTEEPKLETTTIKLAEQIAETTIAPPKQQSSMLEAIVMTTFRAIDATTTEESSTAKMIEELPVTTIEPLKETTTPAAVVTTTTPSPPQTTSSPVTTNVPETTNIPETTSIPETTKAPEPISTTLASSSTNSVPETTSSTTSPPETTSSTTNTPETTTSTTSAPETTSITEDITETTIEPPKQQSMLAASPEIVVESSTTEATTTSSTSTTTTTTAIPTTTTSSTTTTTTTEPIPIVVTREPRVERIFNPDGVEVLYGYSSVVRTNGV